MENYFVWQHEVGEMIGTVIMVFGVMLTILLTKKKSFGIDTTYKKRIFTGVMVAMSILVGAMTSVGFGGHGQINPAVTLMVAALEGTFQEVPAILGFQLIGAVIGATALVIFVEMFVKDVKLIDAFALTKQTPQKTAAIEFFGNIVWLLPIGALLVVMFNGHNIPLDLVNGGANKLGDVDKGFGHFELVVVAIAGKFILVAGFEEFGGAAFNGNAWFARVAIATYATRKLPFKPMISEVTAVTTSLTIGLAVGYFSKLFLKY